MVALLAFNERGIVEAISAAAERLFGYRSDEVVGQPLSLLLPGTDYAALIQRAGSAEAAPEQPAPERADLGCHKHDRRFPVELTPGELHLDRRRLFVTLVEDLAARGRLDEARLQSERRLRQIFERAGIGITRTDSRGHLVETNAAFRRMIGYGALELRGRPLADFVQADDAASLRRALQELASGRGEHRALELRYLHKDGRPLWTESLLTAMRDPTGGLDFCFGLSRDISARKEADRQLQALARAEKLRALGQLASGVAHDLNQNLGLVAGHGELALRALEQAPADLEGARDSLRIVIQAALDGAETVKRLQAFARPRQEGAAETVDLGLLLREVAELTAPRWREATVEQGRPVRLVVEATDQTTVAGWPGSLREALTNLIFNAIDALPHGGQITLRTWQAGEQVVVQVVDDGIGMTEDVQARAFEPFFTTKGERGTGLGLSMVFGIVERQGGQISLESAPGRGTTFQLTFPAAASAALSTGGAGAVQPAVSLQVLVVDDVPELSRVLSRMIASVGHQVGIAASGEEALELLAAEPFDLVISDLGLGAGMNGWDLAEAVRQRYPAVRFHLATGWGGEIDPEQARERGVLSVIDKPYRLSEIRKLLQP